MTKKDFQLIAATIAAMPFDGAKYLSADDVRLVVASHFADSLTTTNPLFKRELFIQAATGVVSSTAHKPLARTLASDLAEDR